MTHAVHIKYNTTMTNMNPIFLALLKEAQFTKQLLGSGATEIRRANYAKKGIYFHSFTNLSTGLERIGKLCLMLDHYVETGGDFPNFEYLKKEIGHNLLLLQEKAIGVIQRRGLKVIAPSTQIHQAIIKLLSEFALGDRYSNIDLIVGAHHQSDPIAAWHTQVDIPIFESCVSSKKKDEINKNAKKINQIIGPISYVMHTSEIGSEISNIQDASYLTGLYEAVAPHRQLYVLQIIRFWAELLRALHYLARSIGKDDIPFFGEIFAPFENDDSYIKTCKIWDDF